MAICDVVNQPFQGTGCGSSVYQLNYNQSMLMSHPALSLPKQNTITAGWKQCMIYPLFYMTFKIVGCLLSFAQVKNQVTVQIYTDKSSKLCAHKIRDKLEKVSNLPLFLFFFFRRGRGGHIQTQTMWQVIGAQPAAAQNERKHM